MWGYLNSLSGTLSTVTEFCQNNKETVKQLLKKPPAKRYIFKMISGGNKGPYFVVKIKFCHEFYCSQKFCFRYFELSTLTDTVFLL